MNETHKNNSEGLEQKILQAIEAGDITMRPRWHFVLKAVLGIFAVVTAGLALFYFASFLVFTLYRAAPPRPGLRLFDIFYFLESLPWLLIIASLVFVVLVEKLIRSYSFGYNKPLLYSLLFILSLTCLAVFALDRIRAHERFYHFIDDRRVPIFRPFYHHFVPGGEGLRIIELRR